MKWLTDDGARAEVVVVSNHEQMLLALRDAKKRGEYKEHFAKLHFVYLKKPQARLARHLSRPTAGGHLRKKADQHYTLTNYSRLDRLYSDLADCTVDCSTKSSPKTAVQIRLLVAAEQSVGTRADPPMGEILHQGGTMTAQWDFAYLLPHTHFSEPIDHGPVALVPHDDPRLAQLAAASPAVARLTSHFTDQFGVAIEPSAILVRSDGPKDFYAVASFRNAIAISSIIDGYSRHHSGGRMNYPLWSDYFDLYAFTATKDDYLAARSLASMEINSPSAFVGQRAPHLASS